MQKLREDPDEYFNFADPPLHVLLHEIPLTQEFFDLFDTDEIFSRPPRADKCKITKADFVNVRNG